MIKWLAMILGILFVVMKVMGLGEVAAWSWWAVTSPIWGYVLLSLATFVLIVMAATLKD